MLKTIPLKSKRRNEFIDISAEVKKIVENSGIDQGTVTIFVPHTTAAVTINENADPDVKQDFIQKLEQVFPREDGYQHAEGNSDAHIKASLVGPSVQLIVHQGKPLLGTWQAVYFCEFDGPRARSCHIQVLGTN